MGCLRPLVGCAVVLVVLAGLLVWGGASLLGGALPFVGSFIQRAGPTVQGYLELSRRVETLVPGGPVSTNLNVVNGRSTLVVNVGVPFDPGADAARAKVLADRIAALVRREAPAEPRPERLEVRLGYAPAGGSRSERSFGYDLGARPASGPRS